MILASKTNKISLGKAKNVFTQHNFSSGNNLYTYLSIEGKKRLLPYTKSNNNKLPNVEIELTVNNSLTPTI